MSDAMVALGGADWTDGIARIEEMPLQGMITLRGDLGSDGIKNAATGVAAVEMPDQGQGTFVGECGIFWMSPDELLVLCPYNTVAASLEKVQATLKGQHALAVDVSDARAMFRLSCSASREVMAKLAPVDLAPGQFEPGQFRRTRLAQIPAAFWMPEADVFQIICFRSNATYLFDLLKVASQPNSEVGFF